uniref:Replicative polymerase delta family B n=1 Tax=Clandestinovirus TaxID=2831644 RepID=A0A8F8KTP9_9VIRU|nr:replicative polymerase delta family B [Clandestinovirus]
MEQDKSAYRQRQKLIEELPNDEDYQRFSEYLEITPFHPDELRGEDLFFQVVDMERSDTRSLTMEGDEQPLVARSPLIKFSDYDNQALPTVHLIGRSPNGWTVCANVHGMSPYFYIEVDPEFGEEHCDTLMDMLENHLMEQYAKENTFYPFNKEPPSRHILDVSMVHNKKNLFFAKTNTDCFVKVTLLKPDYLRSIRDWIEDSTLTADKWKESAHKHPQGRFEMDEFPKFTGQWKTFESNLDYILRLVVNKELDGSAWIKLAGSDYIIREGRQKVSNCQVEVDVYYEDVEPLAKSNDSRWNEPAPFKQMSYDLECAAIDEKSFPEPSKDPVINISVVTWDFAKLRNADGTEMDGAIDKPWKKCVFTWGGCAEIPGSKVFNYETEKEMFEAYFKFVHVLQPDYVTGWNTSNFDEPYLLDRAQTLKVPFFAFRSKLLSRPIRKEPITMEFGSGAGKIAKNKLKLKQKRKGKRLTVAESIKILLAKIHREVQGERREELTKMVHGGAPFGAIIAAIDSIELEDKEATDLFSDLKETLANDEAEEEEEKAERVNYNIEWPGTVWMDGLPVVKTFLKKMLRRYTLNAVASDIIGQQKSDMPYDQIPKLFFHGSNADRRKIASYCIKDSLLAAEIVDKLMAVLNLLEMSKATRVTQEMLMKKGQSKKVFTMIYYYAHHHSNYLVPFHAAKEEDLLDQEEVEGAVVIDAKASTVHSLFTRH